ncbi:hypothetical protein VKT23_016908 [Stygiomarasmius scandens]|uniref:Retrovirus-related Pol polyprotein from transposon TNT 1-94-like beta-barrel domain-containing protein n=1 Tax=Marasmiellus scandens TaxID=2682957 RepID=A0ABR1IY49_9AGAR
MNPNNCPSTAFASAEHHVPRSRTTTLSSGLSDYEYIPDLHQPTPVRSSTMTPILTQQPASATWDYLQMGSFTSTTSPSSQRTIVTPHTPNHVPLPSSPSSCAVSVSPSSLFPSLSPLLDTLRSPYTPASTYTATRTTPDLVSLPSHHSPVPPASNPYIPFLDPHPSVRYDYNTVYTPPPVPMPSRSSLLSPLGLHFNQRGTGDMASNPDEDLSPQLTASHSRHFPESLTNERTPSSTAPLTYASRDSPGHVHSSGLAHNPSLPTSPVHSRPGVNTPWPRNRYPPPSVHTVYTDSTAPGGVPRTLDSPFNSPGHAPTPQMQSTDLSGYALPRNVLMPLSTHGSPVRPLSIHSNVPETTYSVIPPQVTTRSPFIERRPSLPLQSSPHNTIHTNYSVHSMQAPSPAAHSVLYTPITQHLPPHVPFMDETPRYNIPEPSQGAITIAQGTMKDLEVLKGTDNFVTWESQVLNIITSLSLTGHICPDPPPGEQCTLFNTPVTPPADPTSTEFSNWRRNDQLVSGLILQRLASDIRRGILPALTEGRPTTAREHWGHIQQRWGLANDVRIKAMLRKLFTAKASSINDLDMYITKYRNTINTVSGSRRELDWSEILQNLADGLPRQLPLICPVYLAISRQADQGPDFCTRQNFEPATLELQNLWVCKSSSYERKQKKDKGKADLTCEGCGGPGHTFENCRDCKHKGRTLQSGSANTVTPKTPTASKPSTTTNSTVASTANVKTHTAYSACFLESSVYDVDTTLYTLQTAEPELYESLRSQYDCILDSGATQHLIRDRSHFITYDPAGVKDMRTANCGVLTTKASGTCLFRIYIEGSDEIVVLELVNCLHAPRAPVNLFSAGSLIENGFKIILDDEQCEILTPRSLVLPDQRSSWSIIYVNRLFFLSGEFVDALFISHSRSSHQPVSSPILSNNHHTGCKLNYSTLI